jgi:Mce-associated membrane protein
MTSSDAPPTGAGTSSPDAASGRAAALSDGVVPDYATWLQRVVAAVLDDAILAGATWLALGAGFTQPTLTPAFLTDGDAWPLDPLILVPVGALVLLLVLQGVTGWTPGKLVVGIRVVDERSAGPAGVWKTLARWVLHLLDALLFIGYLRPLWHRKRQTFADGIVGTVVVPALPDLPRRPRTIVHAAALVAVVLGLGYGCVPLSSSMGSTMAGPVVCEVAGAGPALTSGEIRLGGSVVVNQERRLWTVRESRTAQPGATLTWASDPSARDVGYRVELDARPVSGEGGPVSHSWDLGTGGSGGQSGPGQLSHTRRDSPDGDVHDAQVELAESDGALVGLGTDLTVRVRLLADGEVVADCAGTVAYDDGGPSA